VTGEGEELTAKVGDSINDAKEGVTLKKVVVLLQD
jgi:hypothetical protein